MRISEDENRAKNHDCSACLPRARAFCYHARLLLSCAPFVIYDEGIEFADFPAAGGTLYLYDI